MLRGEFAPFAGITQQTRTANKTRKIDNRFMGYLGLY
jgi:hypothetical protein